MMGTATSMRIMTLPIVGSPTGFSAKTGPAIDVSVGGCSAIGRPSGGPHPKATFRQHHIFHVVGDTGPLLKVRSCHVM